MRGGTSAVPYAGDVRVDALAAAAITAADDTADDVVFLITAARGSGGERHALNRRYGRAEGSAASGTRGNRGGTDSGGEECVLLCGALYYAVRSIMRHTILCGAL